MYLENIMELTSYSLFPKVLFVARTFAAAPHLIRAIQFHSGWVRTDLEILFAFIFNSTLGQISFIIPLR